MARPGFALHFRSSPATKPWEPLYSREREAVIDIGFEVTDAHCNSRGILHGGVIAALADNAMGLSYGRAASGGGSGSASGAAAVTVHLSIDYVSSARKGDWIEINPRIIRAGSTIGFVDAIILADGRIAARANAVFRMLGTNQPDPAGGN
jgi:uncharacterized protein (TIGR00369 family)